MKIQFNTDKTINGEQRKQQFFSDLIEKELALYESLLSRIEVHLSDQNGKKEGREDILCLLEARMNGKKPIAVSEKADTIELSVLGAIDKLKAALETIVGRLRNHN